MVLSLTSSVNVSRLPHLWTCYLHGAQIASFTSPAAGVLGRLYGLANPRSLTSGNPGSVTWWLKISLGGGFYTTETGKWYQSSSSLCLSLSLSLIPERQLLHIYQCITVYNSRRVNSWNCHPSKGKQRHTGYAPCQKNPTNIIMPNSSVPIILHSGWALKM